MSEGQNIPVSSVIKASEDARAFYDRLANKLISLSRRYKNIRSLETVSIVGRLLGVMIAQVAPADRELAKKMALINIDIAIEKIHPTQKEQENGIHDTAKDAG